MNIMEIIPQGELRSGGGIQMYRLSKSLKEKGHQVFTVYKKDIRNEEDFKEVALSGINLTFMKLDRIRLNIETLRTILNLRKYIKKNKIEIIHSHKGSTDGLCLMATLGMNIPIIGNRGVINSLNWFRGLKYRSKKIEKIVAVSQIVKDVMAKTGKIDPNKIEVIYGGVDIEEFKFGKKSTIREEFTIDDDKIIIGFAGNAGPRKGLPYLLEAFEKIAKKYENTVLLLIGLKNSDLGEIKLSDSIKNRVVGAGFRRDVPNCMAAMDIFAFSGIAEEGLTGTVREACAMKVPVITTDVAGNRELITDKIRGIVVPKKDADAMALAIEYMIENREETVKMAERARQFIEENMTNEIRAEKIEKLYNKVLEKRKKIN